MSRFIARGLGSGKGVRDALRTVYQHPAGGVKMVFLYSVDRTPLAALSFDEPITLKQRLMNACDPIAFALALYEGSIVGDGRQELALVSSSIVRKGLDPVCAAVCRPDPGLVHRSRVGKAVQRASRSGTHGRETAEQRRLLASCRHAVPVPYEAAAYPRD